MNNQLRVEFSQYTSTQSNELKYSIQFENETNLGLNKVTLKRWASELLFDLLKLCQLANVHSFDLRRPIYADVFFNNKLELELVQKVIGKNSRILEGFDFPYDVKKRKYLLTPKKHNTLRTKKYIGERKVEHVNLDKLLKSIEYSTRERIKYGTPVLYTGMTQ